MCARERCVCVYVLVHVRFSQCEINEQLLCCHSLRLGELTPSNSRRRSPFPQASALEAAQEQNTSFTQCIARPRPKNGQSVSFECPEVAYQFSML